MSCFITSEGLKIATHRLFHEFSNNPNLASQLDRIRMYDSSGNYADAPIVVGMTDTSFELIGIEGETVFYREVQDIENGNWDSYLELTIRGYIPQKLFINDGLDDEYLESGVDSLSVVKLEIMNRNGGVFAKYEDDTGIFTRDTSKTEIIDWKIQISNSTITDEWNNFIRNCITRFGLDNISHRLLYETNRGLTTKPPIGMNLRKTTNETTPSIYAKYGGSAWDRADDDDSIFLQDSVSIQFGVEDFRYTKFYLPIQNEDDINLDDEYNLTFQYYNGSSWTDIENIADYTRRGTKAGYVTFLMPDDWEKTTDPYLLEDEAYYIRINPIDSAAGSGVVPRLDMTELKVYVANIDDEDGEPKTVQSQKAGQVHLGDRLSSASIFANFQPEEIGFMLEDMYMRNLVLSDIRAVELGVDKQLYQEHREPEQITVSSADVSPSDGTIKFDKSTYLEPMKVLMIYGADGTCPSFEDLDNYNDGSDWYVGGFQGLTSQDYELVYIPREFSLEYISNSEVDRIASIFGPSRNIEKPSRIYQGRAPTNILSYNPSELERIISDDYVHDINERYGKQSTVKRSGSMVDEVVKGISSAVNLEISALNAASETMTGLEEWATGKDRLKTPTIGYWTPIEDKLETKTDYGYLSGGGQIRKIPMRNGNTLMFSFDSDYTRDIVVMEFNNSDSLNKGTIELQLQINDYGGEERQSITGYDVYLWCEQGDQGNWQKLGSYGPYVTRMQQSLMTFKVSGDNLRNQTNPTFLIMSKLPNFTEFQAYEIKKDVDISREHMQNWSILEQYMDQEDIDYKKSDFDMNRTSLKFMWGRLVGIGSSKMGGRALYKEGIDYTWDGENIKIVPETSVYRRRDLNYPIIGIQEDVFTDIGVAGYKDNTKYTMLWNTDVQQGNTDLDTYKIDKSDVDLALSKTPFIGGKNWIEVVVSGKNDEVFSYSGSDIRWEEDYEYGSENEWRDNRIKAKENGHGCWIINILTNIPLTHGDPVTIRVRYPYLMDNSFTINYIKKKYSGIFGRCFREDNTMYTPININAQDSLNAEIEVYSSWPSGKDPSLQQDPEEIGGVPVGGIVWFAGELDELPTNYQLYKVYKPGSGSVDAGSYNLFVKATKTFSSNIGQYIAGTHTHTIDYTADLETDTGFELQDDDQGESYNAYSDPGDGTHICHKHEVNIDSETTEVEGYQPEHIRLYLVKKISAGPDPIGIILYLYDSIGDLPSSWKYADGSGYAYDLRGYPFGAASNDGYLRTVKGSSTHKHRLDFDITSCPNTPTEGCGTGTYISAAYGGTATRGCAKDSGTHVSGESHEHENWHTLDYTSEESNDIDYQVLHALMNVKESYELATKMCIFWDQEDLPDGWSICDGTAAPLDIGTDRYIVASDDEDASLDSTTDANSSHDASSHDHSVTLDGGSDMSHCDVDYMGSGTNDPKATDDGTGEWVEQSHDHSDFDIPDTAVSSGEKDTRHTELLLIMKD